MGQCYFCASAKKQSTVNFTSFIEALTWKQNKYNLFDYENQKSDCTKFKLQAGFLTLSDDRLNLHPKPTSQVIKFQFKQNEQSIIGKIEQTQESFFFKSSCEKYDYGLNENNIWQSLGSFSTLVKNPVRFEMQEGMVFRLGALRYRVKELNDGTQLPQDSHPVSFCENTPVCSENYQDPQWVQHNCRICFGSSSTSSDPLVSACKCSGSLKWIHLGCLQKWAMRNVNKIEKNKYLSVYYWKNMKCELCHAQMDYFIERERKKNLSIISIPKPNTKYIILEIFNLHDNEVKGQKLIQFHNNANSLKIGRGKEAQIVVKDSSISRIHATISFENSRFYLEDKQSKFGTLVLLDQSINLTQLNTFCGIQIGSNLFRFHSDDNKVTANKRNNNPIILKYPLGSIFNDYSSSSLSIDSEKEIINQIDEEEEKSMKEHDPYVFDEAPELSMHSFTTQQLRKTQFPSFESSKFKIIDTKNPITLQQNQGAKQAYMPSTELLQQLSSNQIKY